MPTASATASATRAGSRIGASSTSHAPSECSSDGVCAPTSTARLVLPTPPGPVSVTSRCSAKRVAHERQSASRPTKLVSRAPMFVAWRLDDRQLGRALQHLPLERPRLLARARDRAPRSRCEEHPVRGERVRRDGRFGTGPASGAARAAPAEDAASTSRSRSGSASPCRPSSRSAASRSSRACSSSSLRRRLSACAKSRSMNSPYGSPRQSASACSARASDSRRLERARLGNEPREALRVDVVVRDREPVAERRLARCRARLEQPAKLRDPHVERALCGRRRPLAPHGVDELARRDGTPEVREQISEDRALLRSRKLERTLRPDDLEEPRTRNSTGECYAATEKAALTRDRSMTWKTPAFVSTTFSRRGS